MHSLQRFGYNVWHGVHESTETQIVKLSRSIKSWLLSDPWSELKIAMLLMLAVALLTRIALTVTYWSQVNDLWWKVPVSVLAGIPFDIFVAFCTTFLFALFLVAMPQRFLAWRPTQWILVGGFFLFTYGLVYLGVVEMFFFDEFNSRFNYVAVDYLLYPHEVFANIWDSYPVLEVLIAVFIVALALTYYLAPRIRTALASKKTGRSRFALVGVYLAVMALGYFALNINLSRISNNRVLNEITANGMYSFFYAAATNELEYDIYYSRIGDREAVTRLRDQMKTPDAEFVDPVDSLNIARVITDTGAPRRFNIVLVLEESLGSAFVGLLHPEGPACTPQFDSLANAGLLFTHIYATGNRTVRGVEASLLSFPPIPGQSIVKRPLNENLFSLPGLLKEQGYQTVFLYGGRSYFDNFLQFTSNNYFDKIIDQTDFPKVTYETIWGVCDGDLFDNSLSVFDSLQAVGKPFFATIITVSNHKPYLYPEGKIPYDPKKQDRLHAVRYADFAIGDFIRNAKSHDFFDSTIFVFLGDHGARVYGWQQIPMDSYEIPILFYCPALIPPGSRVDLLGSQMDLAPTLLDTLNFSYTSKFFGRSLFKVTPDQSFALMSHNRDVSLYRDDKLAVLGILMENGLWSRDPADGKFTPLPMETDSTLLHDAIGYYQTAYRLYSNKLMGM